MKEQSPSSSARSSGDHSGTGRGDSGPPEGHAEGAETKRTRSKGTGGEKTGGGGNETSLKSAFELKENVRSEVEKRHEYWKKNGKAYQGHSTGFEKLDDIIEGISQCGLYVLAGMPGVGKTSFASRVAFEVAREIPVVYLSFENRPVDLTWRLLSSENSKGESGSLLEMDRLREGNVDEEEIRELLSTEAFDKCLKNLHFLDGRDLEGKDGRMKELEMVRSVIDREVEAPSGVPEGLPRYLLVIDYLQLWAKRPDVTQDIGSSSTRFRIQKLASDLSEVARGGSVTGDKQADIEGELAVLAVASQNRQSYDGGAQDKSNEDALQSLKGSGDVEYIADVAMLLSGTNASDGTGREVTLNVAKNRYGETGEVTLNFEPRTSSWSESSS